MVSVSIPVYNAEKYLPDCIERVCRRTLTDLEILLVDDGSTDRSGKICDEFAGRDKRIVVIHQENGGSTRARKAGLRKARPAFRKGVYQRGDRSGDILVRNLIYSEDYRTRGISPNLCDKLFDRELLGTCQFQVDERYFERMTFLYRRLKQAFSEHPSAEILLEKLNRYMLEFIFRGVNQTFGFGWGVPLPFYLPPFSLLKENGLESIVLYGAGEVGILSFAANDKDGSDCGVGRPPIGARQRKRTSHRAGF